MYEKNLIYSIISVSPGLCNTKMSRTGRDILDVLSQKKEKEMNNYMEVYLQWCMLKCIHYNMHIGRK
jgi:hypothetical protein